MKLRELVEKQGNNTYLSLYVDGQLSLSADTDYLKESIKDEDIRGEYTVLKFCPTILNHYSGEKYVHMNIYTKSRRVNR